MHEYDFCVLYVQYLLYLLYAAPSNPHTYMHLDVCDHVVVM